MRVFDRATARWRRRSIGGVRRRLTLIAVAVVFVALVAGGALLLAVLQYTLRSSATAAATSRAAEVAQFATAQGISETGRSLRAETRSGEFVQLVDRQGVVVASSSPLVQQTPLSGQEPAVGATLSRSLDLDTLGTPGDWIVLARGVSIAGRAYVVQVAVPVDVQRETVQTVAGFILASTPVLLLAVAVAVWALVGRTLRPVERIRATVAGIEPHRLSERVPVPATADEVAALAVTMNVMLARLEASDLAQRSFISDAGHELRSPLAAVTAALDVAAVADPAGRDELIRLMGAEVQRMGGLVEDLMTLARADSDVLLGSRADVDLDDVVEVEIRRLQATSRHEIAIDFVPVRVQGDDRRLTQVLRNLLDNAERYARSRIDVRLRIEHRSSRAEAVLDVDNDGPPIPPADRERIFERFVRLDESRQAEAGGRGLGLAITRQIVEQHGGTVAVADGPEGGCRFEVRLPVARS